MARVVRVLNEYRTTVLVIVALVAIAPGLEAQRPQSIDLATSVSADRASAGPGELVTYSVDYSNLSAGSPFQAVVNLNFPPVYGLFEWDDATVDAVEASFTDTNGNNFGLFFNGTCDGLLIQVQGDDIGVNLPGNSTGTFTVEMPMAAEPIRNGVVRIDSPPELAGPLAYGDGVCDDGGAGNDCEQDDEGNFIHCFGPRLPFVLGESLPLELVNDGTANPTFGCEAIQNDLTGKVALIRRGECQFGLKAFNAEAAGASAAIIMNNTTGAFGMLPGDFGTLVNIPVVSIEQVLGNDLEAAVAGGTAVMVTIGGIETNDLTFTSQIFHTTNSNDTDPDPANDNDTVVVTLTSGGPDAPVAAFTYAPAAPGVDQVVTFTDTSTNSPTSWAWNFGDGATSTVQNPTHAYAAAGTYTVSLTATNAGGSDTASMDVTVTGGGEPTLDNFYFVPAAAFASGAAGSFFITDLDVNNAGTTTASYKFLWLPRGADNSTPAASELFTLGPGVAVRYSNVLSEVFGAADGAVGALAIISDSANLLFMSRTFNQADEGTFGQAIPGYSMMDLIPANTRMRILFMTENDDYRSNLGLMNGTASPITVQWERFTADGASLGTGSRDLAAWSNTQLNRVFNDVAPVAAAYVDVWTTSPGAYFAAYGSVLDSETSDPTTVLPQ